MELIAKPNTWFDSGTIVDIIEDLGELGYFCEGLHNGKIDQEICPKDEFVPIPP